MAHFQQDITSKQDGWQVETSEGTYFIPGDVAPVPEWLARGIEITEKDDGDLFALLLARVEDYCGRRVQSIEAISDHYFCRMSAPGYLDCTDWSAFKSLRACRDYLRDYYGEC